MLVTCDVNGNIRLWSADKKFLREIQFPNPIDSVIFLNQAGDLLVSHESRISHIKFEAYWCKIFDYYGYTNKNTRDFTPIEEQSVYSDADFVVGEDHPRRVTITSEEIFNSILNPATQVAAKGLQKKLDLDKINEQAGLAQAETIPRRNSIITRSSPPVASRVKNIVSSKPVPTATESAILTRAPETLQSSTSKPKKKTEITLSPEELEAIRQEKMRQIYLPSGVSIPKEKGLARVGMMQPLPGVSYLATSPTYYEMMAR